jgi:HlyD family secretion protein
MKNLACYASLCLSFSVAFASVVLAQSTAPPAKATLTISVAAVQRMQWSIPLKAGGSIAAWQEAVVSSRSNGLPIIEINADIGSVVKRNQVLARFDARGARADLVQAEATLAQAVASANQAKANRDRTLKLRGTGAISEETLLQSTTSADTAIAQVDLAKAAVDSAQVRLENTIVAAPDSGVITTRSATLGQAFGTSTELFRLIRQNRLEWRAEVPAQELSRIGVGQTVDVILPDASKCIGSVRQIAPALNTTSRLGIVHVDLKAGCIARPSMYVDGIIQTGSAPALVVPAESVVIRDGRSYVFVLNGNRVQRIAAVTGRREGNLIEVTGIKADQIVAVRGAGFLADGDVVQVAAPLKPAITGKTPS